MILSSLQSLFRYRKCCLCLLPVTISSIQALQGVSVSARFLLPRSSAVIARTTKATTTTTTTTRLHYDVTGTMPMIDQWVVTPDGCMQGKVVNHPSIDDGATISTSPLTVSVGTVALNNHGIVVETQSGSKYRLLKPNRQMTLDNDRTVDICIHGPEEDVSKFKKLARNVKARGVASAKTAFSWELGFWTVSLPLSFVAFHQIWGYWPDLSSEADLELLGTQLFAKFNADRLGTPLRVGVGAIFNRFSADDHNHGTTP